MTHEAFKRFHCTVEEPYLDAKVISNLSLVKVTTLRIIYEVIINNFTVVCSLVSYFNGVVKIIHISRKLDVLEKTENILVSDLIYLQVF